MYKGVKHAIYRKAYSDIPERRPPKRTGYKEGRGNNAKANGVEVVGFKISFGMSMMTFMPTPSWAMHVIFMKEYCEDFHTYNTSYNDE